MYIVLDKLLIFKV